MEIMGRPIEHWNADHRDCVMPWLLEGWSNEEKVEHACRVLDGLSKEGVVNHVPLLSRTLVPVVPTIPLRLRYPMDKWLQNFIGR